MDEKCYGRAIVTTEKKKNPLNQERKNEMNCKSFLMSYLLTQLMFYFHFSRVKSLFKYRFIHYGQQSSANIEELCL